MYKNKAIKLTGVLLVLFLTACRNETVSEMKQSADDIFSDLDTVNNSEGISSSIIIETGVYQGPDTMEFVYDGSPIEFDYFMDADGACEMGLKIYVNGFSQPYLADGEETFMHVVSLNDEMKVFHVSFQPVDGEKGEVAELLFTSVFNPIVMEPDENGSVNFGNNQNMSSPLFWSINMKSDCRSGKISVEDLNSTAVCRNFTEEEKASFIHSDVSGNRKDDLDYFHLELWNEKRIDESTISWEEDGMISLKLYGGNESVYRVSFYSNFELLKINGKSYYDISVKKGQETSYDISLKDIPAGKDFYVMVISLDSDGDWAKSSSCYIRK